MKPDREKKTAWMIALTALIVLGLCAGGRAQPMQDAMYLDQIDQSKKSAPSNGPYALAALLALAGGAFWWKKRRGS